MVSCLVFPMLISGAGPTSHSGPALPSPMVSNPFFRDAFKRKRCLVLADGFYEWKRAGKGKVPYRIALKTEEPFAFAGSWSTVHDAQGEVHPTFAILATEANALIAQIHTRMPVILREQD